MMPCAQGGSHRDPGECSVRREKKADTHLKFGPFAAQGQSQVGLSALWPFHSGPNLHILLLFLNLFISSYRWS